MSLIKNQEPALKILIVDDEKAIGDILSASLEDDGYVTATALDGVAGLETMATFQPQLVFLDIWMPGELDGLQVLQEAQKKFPKMKFIIMSGHGTIETAVKAVKLGAWDFVEKPLSMDKISILIKNIETFQQAEKEKDALLNKLRKNIALIGDSPAMKVLKQMISRVAQSESWVLINGANGTGKELVAQNIHYLSSRASQPFVEVNCAAIPKELIESELFGYEKGAFTGADKQKLGKFDLANGGTLFLDEIGDMSLEAQAKILRILQEQNFQRVGGTKTIQVNVRVIAATNKDLKEEIAKGNFREDLYYRLNVVPFRVPCLKDRFEDIPSLVDHFVNEFTKQSGIQRKNFSEAAMKKMMEYTWPGNVRELKNFVERVYILTPGDNVELHDLKFAGLADSLQVGDTQSLASANFREARAQFERDYLEQKISENNGNISKTAESIGLERSYLHRKIKTYGIEV
ncbi:MAG: sigma-54-dependent Fis family transcriptional regulator [Bdellovibrionales bacterium]|nr:sigma-54-dependent Fis family transcriptional regulator [Bdellovibrionales bacterium]